MDYFVNPTMFGLQPSKKIAGVFPFDFTAEGMRTRLGQKKFHDLVTGVAV